MSVEYRDSNFFKNQKDILYRYKDKLLKIFYGGNGDLYFDATGEFIYNSDNNMEITMIIPNYEKLYSYFDKLISDIINTRVYDDEKELSKYCITETYLHNKNYNSELKEKVQYKKIYHDGYIEWISDNTFDENANTMIIRKDKDIVLTFINNPNDPDWGFGIRICNSGSKYDPFNICFMNMYNSLQDSTKKKIKILKRK